MISKHRVLLVGDPCMGLTAAMYAFAKNMDATILGVDDFVKKHAIVDPPGMMDVSDPEKCLLIDSLSALDEQFRRDRESHIQPFVLKDYRLGDEMMDKLEAQRAAGVGMFKDEKYMTPFEKHQFVGATPPSDEKRKALRAKRKKRK